MDAINRFYISSGYSSNKRIGTLRVSNKYLDFLVKVENFLNSESPLPISFDVRPCQIQYFSEYSYSDFGGGIWVRSMNNETNARYLLSLEINQAINLSLLERYSLSDKNINEKYETVCFLAGSNLIDELSFEILDRIIFENPNSFIKPHPLTHDPTIREYALRYGWNKILDKNLSGYSIFSKTERIYTTTNSELFLRSLIEDKFIDTLTKYEFLAKSQYSPFFALHKRGYTSNQIKGTINNESSGLVFPTQEDWKERLSNYFENSMKFRESLKPVLPFCSVINSDIPMHKSV